MPQSGRQTSRIVDGGSRQMVTASVIVEWYNMSHAELGRARRMLAELRAQAASLYASDARAPVRLAKPLDLVIVFGNDQQIRQQVQSALGDLAKAGDSLVPRSLPISDGRYCQMKNAGAAFSQGEVIIFLDSDVIPEPNWLAEFLEAFSCSRTFVVGWD